MNAIEELRQLQTRQQLAQERHDRHEIRVAELVEAIRKERNRLTEALVELERTKQLRAGRVDDSVHSQTGIRLTAV